MELSLPFAVKRWWAFSFSSMLFHGQGLEGPPASGTAEVADVRSPFRSLWSNLHFPYTLFPNNHLLFYFFNFTLWNTVGHSGFSNRLFHFWNGEKHRCKICSFGCYASAPSYCKHFYKPRGIPRICWTPPLHPGAQQVCCKTATTFCNGVGGIHAAAGG